MKKVAAISARFVMLLHVLAIGRPAWAQAQQAAEKGTLPDTAAETPRAGPEEKESGEAPAPAPPEVVPAKAAERSVSLEPQVAERPSGGRVRFDVDPIADTSVIGVSFGFALVLNQIYSTGELRPQQIAPDFDRSQLLAIDRVAVTATPDARAGTWSNIGLGSAVAFAVVDPILSGYREQSAQTVLVDAMLYAESLSLTMALTNIVKVAVRRPRPHAYIAAEAHRGDPNYSNTSTDSALSFFSGHASSVAAIGATASYLAFARSPNSVRPWLTLVLAAGLTTFVSVERVRAGNHFPTDVIAGSVAGAGVGVIVPHLHRSEDVKQRRVWIGGAPLDGPAGLSGGAVSVSGTF